MMFPVNTSYAAQTWIIKFNEVKRESGISLANRKLTWAEDMRVPKRGDKISIKNIKA